MQNLHPAFFFFTPRSGRRKVLLSPRSSSMAETAVAAPERTLPHNLDAERSVLGEILIDN